MCYRTGKYSVCRRVRASFSPDILQTAAVNGLNCYWVYMFQITLSIRNAALSEI